MKTVGRLILHSGAGPAGGTPETMMQIVPTSKPIDIEEILMTFESTADLTHVTVELVKQDAAGEAGSTPSPIAIVGNSVTPTGGIEFSSEPADPTESTRIGSENVHVGDGFYRTFKSDPPIPELRIQPGDRLGVRIIPEESDLTVYGHIEWSEL